jgi:L-2-hydroxyglutarate oxidase LhgO
MSDTYDVAMIGAGILGLATAYELSTRHPGLDIVVLEKESHPGAHQSGHNSGVLHAGVYYTPGSLKARLCVEGKALMIAFAQEHGISYEICGKLIVALDESELGRLDALFERGTANGVPGLAMVGPERIREIEPHAAGIKAVHSPGTGIIDFAGVVDKLAELLIARGVRIVYNAEVTAITDGGETQVLSTKQGDFRAANVVSCAGVYSDRVASMNTKPEIKIVPFRGDYYTLRPESRDLCRGLIYPVPDPTLPFLGVHFTKRFDGAVWAGPNAVLAFSREGYRRRDLNPKDLFGTLTYPGFLKLATKFWQTGAKEMWRDVVKSSFVKDLQRYVPDVTGNDLTWGPAGVRAQALSPDGSMVDDFVFSVGKRSVHVLNAPSPAATASLAIARLIADKAAEAFDLPVDGKGAVPRTE